MKKLITGIVVTVLSLTFIPAQSEIVPVTVPATTNAADAAAAKVLTNRLEVIDAMDKSALSPTEKRELRKEVRTIKKELKASSGGVYLSVGALLLIIILLIVLL